MEFSFKEIVELFLKRIVLIMVCTLLGLSSVYLINRYVIKPSYTASVQMYVYTNNTSVPADLNQLYYAQKVVNTYINFLQTKMFYTRVLEESGLDYSVRQLKTMTEINAVNDTEIFQINVTSNSPEESYNLVWVMQELAPIIIKEIKTTAEIIVVDPVDLPTSPSGPHIFLNTVAGGVLGFAFAVSIALLWEVTDINVKGQEELAKKYQKPILGAIPSFYFHSRRRKLLRSFIHIKKKKKVRRNETINEDTRFVITEAYKALRTNLRYTLSKDGCKKLLINSPLPEDGKSTTCTNIGITIAQTGVRVLLMDCDLRKGKLHNFFKIKSTPGVSDILSGMVGEKEAIQTTAYTNLFVIPTGSFPPNPTELLAGTQMVELIQKLEKNYDYIIIDSPPINVVSDAISLIKLVDGVVVVVRENNTSHPNIASAITKYEFVKAKILGFVINGVSLKKGNKSRSQYYYYRRTDHD